MLNQVLIPLELGRGVAAHVLVVVGGHGGIEHIHREVQNTVLRVCIGLYHLIYRARDEGFVKVPRGGEVAGIEVTLAGSKQIGQDKQADKHNRYGAATEAGESLGVLRLPLGQEGP